MLFGKCSDLVRIGDNTDRVLKCCLGSAAIQRIILTSLAGHVDGVIP